jgi:hypothetical protein
MLTFKKTTIMQKLTRILDFMDKFKLNSLFNGDTTKVESQLNNMWVNFFLNECKTSVTKAHWPNFHKLIYIAFKLPNTLPMYNKKLLISPRIKCNM